MADEEAAPPPAEEAAPAVAEEPPPPGDEPPAEATEAAPPPADEAGEDAPPAEEGGGGGGEAAVEEGAEGVYATDEMPEDAGGVAVEGMEGGLIDEDDGEDMDEEGEEDVGMSASERRISIADEAEPDVPIGVESDVDYQLEPDDDELLEKTKSAQLEAASGIDVDAKREVLEKKKRTVLGSVISIRRGDGAYYDRTKVAKFQNSYKLDSDKPFNHEKVTQILRDVLEEALLDLTYDQDKVSKQAKWASSAIRAKVKEQEYDRYKIICYVSIGEKLCHDVFMMLRFMWDMERDKYALHVHENMNLIAIGLCFGIYYE